MRDIEYPKPFENITEYLMKADRIPCKAQYSYINGFIRYKGTDYLVIGGGCSANPRGYVRAVPVQGCYNIELIHFDEEVERYGGWD